MHRKTLFALLIGTLVLFACGIAWAEEVTDQAPADNQGPEADPPAEEAEEAAAPEGAPAEAAPAEAAAPVKKPTPPPAPSYPVDQRKINVTITMKNGKTIKGVVKHFLISEKVIDHLSELQFSISDGPTVQHEMDEFQMSWDKLAKIQFNRKNKENGEASCVEDSDKSPDRLECSMTNEYVGYAKDKNKKGGHVIQDRNMFRFVVDTGRHTVNVDSHLGKIRITNERDEKRDMKILEKELNKIFSGAILSIVFN